MLASSAVLAWNISFSSPSLVFKQHSERLERREKLVSRFIIKHLGFYLDSPSLSRFVFVVLLIFLENMPIFNDFSWLVLRGKMGEACRLKACFWINIDFVLSAIEWDTWDISVRLDTLGTSGMFQIYRLTISGEKRGQAWFPLPLGSRQLTASSASNNVLNQSVKRLSKLSSPPPGSLHQFLAQVDSVDFAVEKLSN